MSLFSDFLASITIRGSMGLFARLYGVRLPILIFHRVHAVADPLFPDEPDGRRFESLMRFVASTFNCVTLGEAIEGLKRNNLPPCPIIITFDDGYADNATIALPILQRFGLRATFFISSGFLGGGRMWNDSVIEMMRTTPRDVIDLDRYGLGVQSVRTIDDRRRCINLVLPRIKYLSLKERGAAVLDLQRLCGAVKLPSDLMMSLNQLRLMQRAGMEIGAHTVNHPILKSLPYAEAESEIRDGRNMLESSLEQRIDVFAYPNGKPGVDYDSSHVEMVEKLGFRGAVSTSPGVARRGVDLYELPRFTPWGNATPVWAARLALNMRNVSFATARKLTQE